MQGNDWERLVAIMLHEALDPKQDRGDRLRAGEELQELLTAAQSWLQQRLEAIDAESQTEPTLRGHREGLRTELERLRSTAPTPPGDRLFEFRLQLPHQAASVPVCRLLLRLLLQELAVEAERADEIELALAEAVGNVIEHVQMPAHERCQVVVECFPERVRFQVDDAGEGFRWTERPVPGLEAPCGRGLWLIEQLADEVSVWTRRGGGFSLAAEFRLRAPLPILERLTDHSPDGRKRWQ